MLQSLSKLGILIGTIRSSVSRHDSNRDRAEIASQYIKNIFQSQPGIYRKIIQSQALQPDATIQENASESLIQIEKTPADYLKALFQNDFGLPLFDEFPKVSDECITASLSHVAFASDKNDKVWALKFPISNVKNEVESQLRALNLLPNIGPARKWGIPLHDYKLELHDTMMREMNFEYERNAIREVSRFTSQSDYLRSPSLHDKIQSKSILCMSYESGTNLSECVKWERPLRIQLAEKLVKCFLEQVLIWPCFQTDWNAGNFLVHKTINHLDIILLDFGSYFFLKSNTRQALKSLFQQIQLGKISSGARVLIDAGFDPNKLLHIHDHLNEVLEACTRPFFIDGGFNARQWDMGEEIEKILANQKWWFRSAGSPEVFHFLRAYAQLIQTVRYLDVTIDFRRILKEISIPDLNEADSTPSTMNSLSDAKSIQQRQIESEKFLFLKNRSLRIRVVNSESRQEIADVTLPAQAAVDIESFIPDEYKRQIPHLDQWKLEILDSLQNVQGRSPEIFVGTFAEKTLRIWIE